MNVRIFGFLFSAIGLPMFIAFMVVTGKTFERMSQSIRVPGTIVDLNGGRPKVAYEFPPETKRILEGNVGGSGYAIGETLEVLVDRDNPANASLGDFASLWFVPLMFFLFGATFGGTGVGILWNLRFQKQKKEFLIRNGEKGSAKIVSVGQNPTFTVNGQHPYRITAQARIGSEVFVFKSENLWFNPKEYIDREEVDVYMAIGNPRKYYMDISFLPKLSE